MPRGSSTEWHVLLSRTTKLENAHKGNQHEMDGSRWMEKNYIWEDASKNREPAWKNERQSMGEENDFCFGLENRRSVAREREKKLD